MLKDNVAQALSDQVNAEYFSAYLYLAMSAHCDRLGFKGMANWLQVQAKEEMAHGTHIFEHILERGAAPSFASIEVPPQEYTDLTALFALVLSHEQLVTERINKIATLALAENDHTTYIFMQWYLNEQVEEEASADHLLTKVRHIGDNMALLYQLDAELAARVFVDPFAAAGQAS